MKRTVWEVNGVSEKIINGNLKKNKFSLPTIPSNKKRYLWGLGATLSGIALFGTCVWATPIGRIRNVRIAGQYVLGKQEILNRLSLDWKKSIFQLNLNELEENLKADSLVDSVDVSRNGLNGLSIQIQEKSLVGCLEINQHYYYVLETGESVTNQEATTCQGITFKGIETEEGLESLRMFVQFLGEIDVTISSLIKEVVYEPLYGDVNRFSLFLSDGNTIKVNTYTMMKKMAYYPTLLAQVHQVYGDVRGEFHLDVGDSFNPYRDEKELKEKNVEEKEKSENSEETEV